MTSPHAVRLHLGSICRISGLAFSRLLGRRLRFIRQAQHLGFSLREVQELLSLRIDPKASCSEVRQRAQAKIGEIEKRIRGLRRMREALWRLTEACEGRGPTTACPILEALEKPDRDHRLFRG